MPASEGGRMRYRIALLFIGAVLTGCVSTHMRQFIGQDVREVVLSDGPPVNVFDYSERV